MRGAVVLAWHVDYWDYLGWKDPFGSKAFTERQKRYRKTRTLKFFGTPQLFVANEHTRGGQVHGVVTREAKKKPVVRIQAAAKRDKETIQVTVRLQKLDPKAELPKGAAVVCVLFQKEARTTCRAGENAGRKLKEYFVVRQAAAPLAAAQALAKGVTAKLAVPKGVKAENLGVAVLVEDPGKMKTLECAAIAVP